MMANVDKPGPQRAIRTRLLRGTGLIVVVACALITVVVSQTYAAASAIDAQIAASERLHDGIEDMALALREQHDALDQYRIRQSSQTLAAYRAAGARQARADFEVTQAAGCLRTAKRRIAHGSRRWLSRLPPR